MKGDFSRFTFDPKKRYSSVRMQQGRVQLDADWNEQLDITEHRIETEIKDFIGQSGTPEDGGKGGFEITVTEDGKDLKIGKGRYYVEGMLFENHEENARLTNQPDFPIDVPENLSEEEKVELKVKTFLNKDKQDGIFLAYLDVWQRHITALEDPDIREVALGEADTATRVKNVWQVKLQWMGDISQKDNIKKEQSNISRDWEPNGVKPISTGQLSAQVKGITTLENQLYRVEIHTSGNFDTATFKWSRDNGSVAANVQFIEGNTITINRSGQDAQTGFAPGQWVELVELKDKGRTLLGEPGILVKLEAVEGNKLTVKGWSGGSPPQHRTEPPYTIVRRWDSVSDINIKGSSQEYDITSIEGKIITITNQGDTKTQVVPGQLWEIRKKDSIGSEKPAVVVELDAVVGNQLTVKEWSNGKAPELNQKLVVCRWYPPLSQDNWILLENGIEVKFEPENADYKTGDYWLIPSRHLTGNIEFPSKEPHGVLHRYSRLVLLKRDGGIFTLLDDYRSIFQPLTTSILKSQLEILKEALYFISSSAGITGEKKTQIDNIMKKLL